VPGVFVVGTDTGVGKTVVAAGLILALRRKGLTVRAHKPVASGCRREGGRLVSGDAELLGLAVGMPPGEVCPVLLEEPLAPAVAAERAGVGIDRELLLGNLREAQRGCDFLVVEGVGGLLVPLAPDVMVIDLLAESGLPALLVSRLSLGTINHTLLSLEALTRRGIDALGIIVNTPDSPAGTVAEQTNPDVIAGLTDAPVWGVLPYVPDLYGPDGGLERLAEAFGNHIDVAV